MNATDLPTPQALDAERALLGGLILAPERLRDVAGTVTATSFYRPDHGRLFELLADMVDEGVAVDLTTVADRLMLGGKPDSFGGLAYVLALPDAVPSTANLAYYASIVRGAANRRELLRTLEQKADDLRAGTDATGVAAALTVDLAGVLARPGAMVSVPLREALASKAAEMEKDDAWRVPLDIRRLDELLGGGLRPEKVYVVAALSGGGKTALALHAAVSASAAGMGALVHCVEMGPGELGGRIVASHGHIPYGRIVRGALDQDEWERWAYVEECELGSNVRLDPRSDLTAADIVAEARRVDAHFKRQGRQLAVVVVDYVQLLNHAERRGETQSQAVGRTSRALKQLARDLQVAVLVLSQTNRDHERRGGAPKLADLRDSGQIGQDADAVIFITPPEDARPDAPDDGTRVLHLVKNRAGPTGKTRALFVGRLQRWADLDAGELVI